MIRSIASRLAKVGLLATQAALFFLSPSVSDAREKTPTIFYVTGEESRYELRTYHPSRGTRTILEVPGEPSNFYWTEGFQTINFRVGDDIFTADWRIGSEASKAATLPSGSGENYRQIVVWYDTGSHAWRYHEIEYSADDATETKYFARVFQYSQDTEQREKLVDRETHGCEQGNGSACGVEVRQYTESQGRHVFLSQLSEEMRLGGLMDERGVEYEASMEARDFWFESGGKHVSVVPVFGDSLHAAPPVKWSDGSEPKIVFPAEREYPCIDQVGLKRFGKFLLVATEWYGRCGRVIDLETGATVLDLPPSAKDAVVVPRPEGE